MRRTIIVVIIAVMLMTIGGYILLNKPPRSVETEDFIQSEATDLFEAFQKDEADANAVYLDKVVQVRGTVSEVMVNQDGATVVVLKSGDDLFGVSCSMAGEHNTIEPGMTVTIKGICSGYLSDVIVTRGVLVNND